MNKQSVEDCARQLLAGCAAAKGRVVYVDGTQAADVLKLAKQINPKLDLDDEIERIEAGGKLVDCLADTLAEVCRVVVAEVDGPEAAAAPGGKKVSRKKLAPPAADEGKTADAS